MKMIDLNKIIEEHSLDRKDLAEKLFPMHKYPHMAMSSVLKGTKVLDANQISLLSHYTSIPIQNLFEGGKWSHKYSENIHTLQNGEYKATIDMDTQKVHVYAKGSMLHEELLSSGLTTLRELINKIEIIIKNK